MAAPQTKLWTARENHHKTSGLYLIVGGQVEAGYHEAPLLREAKGDGSTLALDLTLERHEAPPVTNADGKALKMPPVWKAAAYHREVDADQFKAVAIRWENKTIHTVPVIDDREHHALMTKQTKAQNVVHGGKPKAAAAKAAKKAAKKPTKKAVKKTAKKKTKKVAKKSTLKTLVRKFVRKLTPKSRKKKKGKR
jgi:hypothetical protein